MSNELRDFAKRYGEAWSSQKAGSVASFFAESGSLKINDNPPSIGRAAIAEAAQSFMTAFPDLHVSSDGVEKSGDRVIFRWTLTGKNTGPDGTGRRVKISGYEDWRFGPDGLVVESLGHYDSADYDRQVAGVH
jgi:SnoaL-like polyketide cyclase